MSLPLPFPMEGCVQDAEDAADDTSSRALDSLDVGSQDGSSDARTDSEGEDNEPADVRSFNHSFVLQAALQKNLSDPHFNPAHSKIKQPASILQDPIASCLAGIGPSHAAAEETSSERGSVSGPTERVLVATLRSEQQRYDDALMAPSLSDENITAGRWIGNCSAQLLLLRIRRRYLTLCRARGRAAHQVPARNVQRQLQPRAGGAADAGHAHAQAGQQTRAGSVR